MRLLLCLATILSARNCFAIEAAKIRVGIIGLDTSHVVAFTELINDPNAAEDLSGCQVVAAFPQGSPDIPSSVERVPEYTASLREMKIEIVDSIAALLTRVDVVLLETNDGRPHFDQALEVIRAGKPCFIDKPLAGSLSDAVRIVEAAERVNVPIFSSSALRYLPTAQQHARQEYGTVLGCSTYSPCTIEPTHPDLFWYGIHGVELLFTVMGPGCQSVSRTTTKDTDVVVGVWSDGRVGTFRGTRIGSHGYGGEVFTEKGVMPLGEFTGYRPLVVEIVKFFKTTTPPVQAIDTLEIYTFMEAADESKRRNGTPVLLSEVLEINRKKREPKPQ